MNARLISVMVVAIVGIAAYLSTHMQDSPVDEGNGAAVVARPALPEPARPACCAALVDVTDIDSLLEPAPIPPSVASTAEPVILVGMEDQPVTVTGGQLPAPETIPLADE